MTVSFYKCFLVLIFGIILKFVYNNNQSVTEWSLIGQQQHPTNMSIYQSTSCESVTLLRCGMLICPVIWPQHIHFVSVCLCVSISSNEFLVKQNWSSNFVFMQLACLPRRTHEGEFLHHAMVYHCFLPVLWYNNNSNNHDNIYSAVIIAEPLREFTQFTRWIQKWRQVAADLWTKPIGLSRRPAYIGSQ